MPPNVQHAVLKASAKHNPVVKQFLRDVTGLTDTEPLPEGGDPADFFRMLHAGQLDEVLNG